jgi:hypothetical protein
VTLPSGRGSPTFCYASKVTVNLTDLSINFINLENLKKNKKATGRLQDLADLEKLE